MPQSQSLTTQKLNLSAFEPEEKAALATSISSQGELPLSIQEQKTLNELQQKLQSGASSIDLTSEEISTIQDALKSSGKEELSKKFKKVLEPTRLVLLATRRATAMVGAISNNLNTDSPFSNGLTQGMLTAHLILGVTAGLIEIKALIQKDDKSKADYVKLVGTCIHCALAATALATLHLVADQTVTAAIRLSASCLKLAMDLFSLGKLIKDLSECKEEKEKSKIKDNIKQKVFDTVNSVINLTINTARFAPQSYPVTMTLIACSMLLTGVKLYWKHVLTDKTKEKIKDKTGSVLNKLRSAQSNIKARLLKVREQESPQGNNNEPGELVPSGLTNMG